MDIYSSNWNEADSSNSTAAPDGAPEGMAASGVNDVLRAHQGAIKRYVNQQSPQTTAGSSTAYTLAYGTAPGALVDGQTHLVQFNAANGDAPTLNINALGATPLHYYSAGAWRAVPAGLWAADEIFRIAYNTSAGAYRLIDFRNRTGEVVPYAGATAPAGSLLCFGQAISRTAYVGLFTALGTAHGVGDGSTTFNLPDLRGRVAAGKTNMGGSDNGLLSGFSGTTLGGLGGSQIITISQAGATAMDGPNETSNVQNVDASPVPSASINHEHTIHISHSHIQPTIILNYLIRI